jgi:hypothetical protein
VLIDDTTHETVAAGMIVWIWILESWFVIGD